MEFKKYRQNSSIDIECGGIFLKGCVLKDSQGYETPRLYRAP